MTNDIIKFLGFEDSDIEIVNSQYRSKQRIITIRKILTPHYCPVCENIMHSKGIYTRTINHPVMQDGRQIVIKLCQRR